MIRKILTMIVLSIALVSSVWAVTAADKFLMVNAISGYPVDFYLGFETGSTGDNITTTNLGAATNSTMGGSWAVGTIDGSSFQISTSGQQSLVSPVKEGGTVFNDSGSTRGVMYNPNGQGADTPCAHYSFSDLSKLSWGAFYTTTSTYSELSSIVIGAGAMSGDYNVTHWAGSNRVRMSNGGGDACLSSDGSTSGLRVPTNTSVWVTGLFDASATHKLYAFETVNWTLTDYCTAASGFAGGGNVTNFSFGRCGSGDGSVTGVWYWDNVIIRTDGTFPLIPWTPKVNTPSYNNDTGSYSVSVDVTISEFVPGASILYCTDLTGTCTPSTAYTTPITINTDGTHLRSKATLSGWTDSAIKDATYTITVASGRIGYATVTGGSNSNLYAVNIRYSAFQPTVAGPVRYAHIYITSATVGNICLALQDAGAGGTVRLSGSASGNLTGWLNIDMGSSFDLVAETTYWLTSQVSIDSVGLYIGPWDAGQAHYNVGQSYSCGVSVPSTGSVNNNALCIVFDNQSGDPN